MVNPVGFWSYARDDDSQSDGQLSLLRAIVGVRLSSPAGGRRGAPCPAPWNQIC